MGIYDRDYIRNPQRRGGFGSFSMLSVTTWLIIINVAVYILGAFLHQQMLRSQYGPLLFQIPREYWPYYHIPEYGPLDTWGWFSIDHAIWQGQAWRFVTYQFLHANLQHLLLNMLGLFLFAPIVESYLGARRYLIFYLLCGCSGAFVYVALYYLGVLGGPMAAAAPLVGASAGIYGVLVAAAVIAPDLTVVLIFPPIPIQLKFLALIMVGIAGYVAFTQGNVYDSNAGGQAAHLGGAALGFLLIRYPQVLNPFAPRRAARRVRRRTSFKDWSKDMNR